MCTGDVMITGGLGALGALVASWSAQLLHDGRQTLRLLSRSGRPSPSQLQRGGFLHGLLSGAAGSMTYGGRSGASHGGGGGSGVMVTLERCDASAVEDAAAVMRRGARPVGTLLHAAGVLQVSHPG